MACSSSYGGVVLKSSSTPCMHIYGRVDDYFKCETTASTTCIPNKPTVIKSIRTCYVYKVETRKELGASTAL